MPHRADIKVSICILHPAYKGKRYTNEYSTIPHIHSRKIRSCKLRPFALLYLSPHRCQHRRAHQAPLTNSSSCALKQHTASSSSKIGMRMKKDKPSNEQSSMWTRTAIEIVLCELRKRKTLYDQRHPDYLNRSKRQLCLEGICKVLLDKLSLTVSVEHLKNKIQILRAQFVKDLRCMLRSKKYKPKFWCFKKMEWLKPYCNNRYSTSTNSVPSNSASKTTDNAVEAAPSTNGVDFHKTETFQASADRRVRNQSDMTSTTTFEEDAPMSSSNILTSKMVETVLEEPNNEYHMEDINDQFYETIALTQQIVQNRVASKELRADKAKTQNSWEGELVKSQLDLISDETIRSDTMWEIQCVLRRGIEQDRVLPKRRRRKNREPSIANSEVSLNGSYISLDSNNSIEPDMNNVT